MSKHRPITNKKTGNILSLFFHITPNKPIFAAPNLTLFMKPDQNAIRSTLQKRELELRRLTRQMKFDQLHQSPVYKKLEAELSSIQQQLILEEKQ